MNRQDNEKINGLFASFWYSVSMIETENHGIVPMLDIPIMADNAKEKEIIAECKKAHPECYTTEFLRGIQVRMLILDSLNNHKD